MSLREQKLLRGWFWGRSGAGPLPPGSLSPPTRCFVIAHSKLELVWVAGGAGRVLGCDGT